MMVEERVGKQILASAGVRVPVSVVVATPDEAAEAAEAVGLPAMVKAQVPAGGRGKAGGVVQVSTVEDARVGAQRLLGSTLVGFAVERVLVEPRVDHDAEYYVAVLDDPLERAAVLLCCAVGGVDIEETERIRPGSVHRLVADIDADLDPAALRGLAVRAGIPAGQVGAVADVLSALWACYRSTEAELVEVNPLVVDAAGTAWALDAKVALDDSALDRHLELQQLLGDGQAQSSGTPLEEDARARGLLLIELDGDVGIVANGAGLTMASLDVVTYYGGRPANFMEVGGDNYTRADAGMEVVLSNPNVRSVLVNFCGAFARTDVMAEGVVNALERHRGHVPVFFSIHGTGADEAVALVRQRLGVEPYPVMDDAVQAAVAAAKEAQK
jgi:succinyl-CoA synthetase beta subunit